MAAAKNDSKASMAVSGGCRNVPTTKMFVFCQVLVIFIINMSFVMAAAFIALYLDLINLIPGQLSVLQLSIVLVACVMGAMCAQVAYIWILVRRYNAASRERRSSSQLSA